MELEDSPAGLIESSSSNDLAETEPAESVQGLEVDEEGYQSCDSEAGLEVDVEMATEDGNLGIGEVPDEELPLRVEGGDMPETQGSEDPLQWQPGRNCGSYISKFSPVTEQALVFIGNAYTIFQHCLVTCCENWHLTSPKDKGLPVAAGAWRC